MTANVVVREAASVTVPGRHVLAVASNASLDDLPGASVLKGILARRNMVWKDAMGHPLSGDVEGALVVWLNLDPRQSAFALQVSIRTALEALYREAPADLALVLVANRVDCERLARLAIFAALANGHYRNGKGAAASRGLEVLNVHGVAADFGAHRERALAHGNRLARELSRRPPNELTPESFRVELRGHARSRGWAIEELGLDELRQRGAGAFCAVAGGSTRGDAAIVRLGYRPAGTNARKKVALVGKGICMDTGGYNLKTARQMHGMHEDMNGAAVALAILHAASALELPVEIDCWLAIAENLIGSGAYVPGQVVTAVDGTTIEVVNTDAEGRMALADTLALAARERPSVILDFATLTNSMACALGTRMSGVFSNRESVLRLCLECGEATGERVAGFPLEPDYDEALHSEVADVKQCTDLGEADHILAARFLLRFVADTPWAHMDLSAYRNEGGLGAISDSVTGFGVAWGVEMLERIGA